MILPSTPRDNSSRQQILEAIDCALSFAMMTVLLSLPNFQKARFWQTALISVNQGRGAAPLQARQSLEELLAGAESCIAEAEAFLQVAEFTIKEARSRALYT
jgi:hypothetical protein